MAQILYLSEQVNPTIQFEFSFICNIVRYPDTDDYKNMERVMTFIQGTNGLPFILSIDRSGNIKWYIDA